jgi:hypothetical protein
MMSERDKLQPARASALSAALREIDSLAERRRWSEQTRRDARHLIALSVEGLTGPAEIGQRFRALARTIKRADRSQTWQVLRRVVSAGLRAQLDRVYRTGL